MDALFRWLWRLGAITTFLYVCVFTTDCIVHFHQGWEQATHERDELLQARRDCASGSLSSRILLDRCTHIRSLTPPVPWHRAVHYTGQHLAQKMTSALQCLIVLAVLGVGAFWLTLRASSRNHNNNNATLWAFMRTMMSCGRSCEGSTDKDSNSCTNHSSPTDTPRPIVVQLPESTTRSRLSTRSQAPSYDRDGM